jgi:hypothetical protein
MAKLLSKKSADRFIEIMVENSPVLKKISFATLSMPVCEYPLLGISRYKTRGIARNSVASLVNPTDVTISFNCKEVVLPLVIPDSYAEDMNTSQEKIANYVARVFGLDMQYLFLAGDTANEGTADKDLLAKTLDGLVKQVTASGNTVDYPADATPLDKLKLLIKALPDNALADPKLEIWIGSSDYTDLWDSIANNSADKALLMKDNKIYYRSKEVVEVPELSKIIVLNPEHVAAGIVRDMTIETQRYPEARGNKVVLSARVDIQPVTDHMVIEGSQSA